MKFNYIISFFRHLPHMSIWFVLFMDTLISILAFSIAYIICYQLQDATILFTPFVMKLSLATAVYLFCFLLFRTYSGIVRHSTFTDLLRFLEAVVTANIILLSINFLFKLILGKSIYLNLGFVVNGSLALLLMYCLRMFAKLAYGFLLKDHKVSTKKIPVLIWGVNENTLPIAEMFNTQSSSQYRLAGFICFNDKLHRKKMMNVPIYSSQSEFEEVVKLGEVKVLFISLLEINLSVKQKLIDFCLENNIEIISIPPVSEWKDGKPAIRTMKRFDIEDLLGRPSIILDDYLVKMHLKDSIVLITGAAGSIGSEIVRQVAQADPQQIILCDYAETPLHDIYLEISDKYPELQFEIYIVNIRNIEPMEAIFSKHKPDYVYHAAAYKHVPMMELRPCEAVLTNVMGTKHMADLSVKHGVQNFVMISTDKAVNPTNVMGASKRIAEIYVQSLFKEAGEKTKFVTTRFGNVLGSNGSVIPRFKDQIERGGPVTVTHPEIIRYFMTIPEACRLVLEAGVMGKGSEIFVFDMGDPMKIVNLAERMIQLAGYIPHEEIKISYTGLRLGEKLYEELLNDKELTIPTHNKKIKIAKVREHSFKDIHEKIQHLVELAHTYENFKVVELMKILVPEFISQNSVYEHLDTRKKIEQTM